MKRILLGSFAASLASASTQAYSSEPVEEYKFTSDSSTSEKAIYHQIEYGLMDFDNAAFVDNDFSEFPVFGLRYTYFFDSIAGVDAPYALATDVGRVSWASVSSNVLTGFPNISGQYFFNDKWDLEYTIFYDEETISNSSFTTKESELSLDVGLNSQINENWELGFGFRVFSEDSESKSEIDDILDYETSNSDSNVFIQSRYRKLVNNQGWDIFMSYSESDSARTIKLFPTYFTSKKNSLGFGVVSVFDKEEDDVDTFVSFSHEHFFSEKASVDYGFGTSINGDSSSRFDINGTWRF